MHIHIYIYALPPWDNCILTSNILQGGFSLNFVTIWSCLFKFRSCPTSIHNKTRQKKHHIIDTHIQKIENKIVNLTNNPTHTNISNRCPNSFRSRYDGITGFLRLSIRPKAWELHRHGIHSIGDIYFLGLNRWHCLIKGTSTADTKGDRHSLR